MNVLRDGRDDFGEVDGWMDETLLLLVARRLLPHEGAAAAVVAASALLHLRRGRRRTESNKKLRNLELTYLKYNSKKKVGWSEIDFIIENEFDFK